MLNTLDGTLAAFREEEIRLLTDIGSTLADMGDTAQEDRQRLLDVAHDLRDMFFQFYQVGILLGQFLRGLQMDMHLRKALARGLQIILVAG